MALKAMLTTLDGVPEAMKGLYVERDGKFYLDVDQESAEEAFAGGLKRNRDQALREAREAKAKLAAYDGIDPVEHQRLKDAAAEAERKKATAEGDFKALERQMAEKHQQEIGAKDGKIGKLTTALERRLKEANLATALNKAGVRPEFADLLQLKGVRFIAVKETEDDFEPIVVQDDGKTPRILDGQGTAMNVDQLVEKVLKVQYPDAFTGTGSSGGGAARSSAGGGGAGAKVIPAGDKKAFLENVDAIAEGKAVVQ